MWNLAPRGKEWKTEPQTAQTTKQEGNEQHTSLNSKENKKTNTQQNFQNKNMGRSRPKENMINEQQGVSKRLCTTASRLLGPHREQGGSLKS